MKMKFMNERMLLSNRIIFVESNYNNPCAVFSVLPYTKESQKAKSAASSESAKRTPVIRKEHQIVPDIADVGNLSTTNQVISYHFLLDPSKPDPVIQLDCAEWKSGKHRTVLALDSYMVSIIGYTKPSELKRDLNLQFKTSFPAVNITLSKLRSLERQMHRTAKIFAMQTGVLACSKSYFEQLVFSSIVTKPNRQQVAATCLLLAAKVHGDLNSHDIVQLISVKTREATSNDAWGPSGTLMAQLSDMTYNVKALPQIMGIIWRRLEEEGKNWRHVYKSLVLLDYLIKTGSDRVLQQCRAHMKIVQDLNHFEFVDKEGRDQGFNVREKSSHIVKLLNDEEKMKEQRERALKAKEMFFRGNLSATNLPFGQPPTMHRWASKCPQLPELTDESVDKATSESYRIENSPGADDRKRLSVTFAMPGTTNPSKGSPRVSPGSPFGVRKSSLKTSPIASKDPFSGKLLDDNWLSQPPAASKDAKSWPSSKRDNLFEDAFGSTPTELEPNQAQPSSFFDIMDQFSQTSTSPVPNLFDTPITVTSSAFQPVHSGPAADHFADFHSQALNSVFDPINSDFTNNLTSTIGGYIQPPSPAPFSNTQSQMANQTFLSGSPVAFQNSSLSSMPSPTFKPITTSPVGNVMASARHVKPSTPENLLDAASPFSTTHSQMANQTFPLGSPVSFQNTSLNSMLSPTFQPMTTSPVSDVMTSNSLFKPSTPENFVSVASNFVNMDNLLTQRQSPSPQISPNPFMVAYQTNPQQPTHYGTTTVPSLGSQSSSPTMYQNVFSIPTQIASPHPSYYPPLPNSPNPSMDLFGPQRPENAQNQATTRKTPNPFF